MKIWIDLTNAPHAHFFRPIIRGLEKRGHEVLITARQFGYLTDILDNYGLDYILVGSHGGKLLYNKLVNSLERQLQLSKIIWAEKPDLVVSKQSPDAARVGHGLGLPVVTYLDNEIAKSVNKLTVPLSNTIIMPLAIPTSMVTRYGIESDRVVKYNGFSELAHVVGFNPRKESLRELGLSPGEYIVARPEPIAASYFNNNGDHSILEQIVPEFKEYMIVLFPRSEKQKERFLKFDNVIIPEKTMDSLSLMYYSLCVISAGGSMNREAIALGTPAVSAYPGELLSVTKWLIKEGVKYHATDPFLIKQYIQNIIEKNGEFKEKIKEFVQNLESPVDVIVKTIEEKYEY